MKQKNFVKHKGVVHPIADGMTKDQQAFLLERLSDATPKYPAYRRLVTEIPPKVRAAKRICDTYQRAQSKRDSRLKERVRKERQKVQETIHTGDFTKALAAVKALESWVQGLGLEEY